MRISVTHELSDGEQAILGVMILLGKQRLSVTDIELLARLLVDSKFEYERLLKSIIKNRGNNWFSDYKNQSDPRLLATLAMLDKLIALYLVERVTLRGGHYYEHERRYGFYASFRAMIGAPIKERWWISDERIVYALTEEGRRIAEAAIESRRPLLRPRPEQRTNAFIAMAFGCQAANLTPFRVDLTEPEQSITEQIIREIRDCKALLADLTYARPSVYFEIGFAQGMGIPVVLVCRADHFRASDAHPHRVHFDIEQHKISFWTLRDDGTVRWESRMHPKERLAHVIGNLKP